MSLVIHLDFRHNKDSFANQSQLSVILPNVVIGIQNPPSISLQLFILHTQQNAGIWIAEWHLLPKSLDLDLKDLQGDGCFGDHLVSGGKLWKSQKLQSVRDMDPGRRMEPVKMFTLKTVIKASEHLSLKTYVTSMLISHSRIDFIYLLSFVTLTTFIKVSFIRPQWHQSKMQMTIAVRIWRCYHFKWAKWERL